MIALFRVRGIPIRLDAGWLIVYGLIAWSLASGYFPYVVPDRSTGAYWTSGLVAAALLFASVLLHEVAHAIVALAFGVNVAGITLHVFGGVAELESDPPHPAAEALIAIVGPLTSFAIGGAMLLARQGTSGEPWLAALLGYLGIVNLAVGFFNLAPGFPLDGGRLLRALLWWWSDRYDWATSVASTVGAGFALSVVAVGVYRTVVGELMGGLWFILLGAFLFEAARQSRQVARLKSALDNVSVTAVMRPVTSVQRAIAAPDAFVTSGDTAWTALSRLSKNRTGTIAVVDGDRVVGTISVDDLEPAIAEASARRKLERAA